MRRKRARTIFWLSLAGSAAMAALGPRCGGLQATAALAFAPISHPAHRLASLLGRGEGSSSSTIAAGRDVGDLAAENERLRQQIERLEGALGTLRQIHQDRLRLGADVLPNCAPLRVIGSDGEVLMALATGRLQPQQDQAVLHYGPVHVGIAGLVAAVGASGVQVRLISDPSVRVSARFGRFDPESSSFTVLATEPPLIEGTGNGMCHVARAKRDELDREKLAVGDWVVLDDSAWPQELRYCRIGQVTAIEDIPAEPGFARILIRPAVELRQLKEVMVYVKDRG